MPSNRLPRLALRAVACEGAVHASWALPRIWLLVFCAFRACRAVTQQPAQASCAQQQTGLLCPHWALRPVLFPYQMQLWELLPLH